MLIFRTLVMLVAVFSAAIASAQDGTVDAIVTIHDIGGNVALSTTGTLDFGQVTIPPAGAGTCTYRMGTMDGDDIPQVTAAQSTTFNDVTGAVTAGPGGGAVYALAPGECHYRTAPAFGTVEVNCGTSTFAAVSVTSALDGNAFNNGILYYQPGFAGQAVSFECNGTQTLYVGGYLQIYDVSLPYSGTVGTTTITVAF